jgi:multiple antibiotic resistance protein
VNEGISNLAVSPLGTPLMAGPGTIVTAMTLAAGAKWYELLLIVAMYGLLCWVTWVMFVNGRKIQRAIGEDLTKVISKLMGLILGVIGTDMILAGVKAAFNL